MIKSEIFKLRIDAEAKQNLEQLAKQNSKSCSSIVRELIRIASLNSSILSSTKDNDGLSN